jgi:hypothetical protein
MLSFRNKSDASSWVWWHTSVISALGRLRQEDHKFKASLGYIVRSWLKKKKKKTSNSSGPLSIQAGTRLLCAGAGEEPDTPPTAALDCSS